jgi:predicted PurR-regulated permease PerM
MKSISLGRSIKILLFLFLLFAGLYFADSVLVPFFFGILLAMLLRPVADWLEQWMSRGISSMLSVLLFFIVTTGLFILFINQFGFFVDDLPQLQEQLISYLRKVQHFIENQLGIPYEEQVQYIESNSREFSESAESLVQDLISELMSLLIGFLIVLIYIFLLLLNRSKYSRIIKIIVPEKNQQTTKNVTEQVSRVASKYLWGRIKVMTVLAVMYVILFLTFDLKYLILLTVVGTIITVIPYVGPFVSGLLPIIVVILTGYSISEIIVFTLVIIIIQLIESYVLEPIILGGEVNLSPLAIILIVIIGNAIWGIAGMIIFVPLLAMIKIYFDNVPHLQPYGELIGSNKKNSKGSPGWLRKIKSVLK